MSRIHNKVQNSTAAHNESIGIEEIGARRIASIIHRDEFDFSLEEIYVAWLEMPPTEKGPVSLDDAVLLKREKLLSE